MKTTLIVFTLLIGAIYLTSCTSSGYSPKEYELNGVWVLQNLKGKTATDANWPNGIPWMELKVNKTEMGGNTGCNVMGGNVYATADKIYFGNIIMTRMYCEGVDEIGFTEGLQSAGAWNIENDRLFLTDVPNCVVIAVFQKGKISQTEPQ